MCLKSKIVPVRLIRNQIGVNDTKNQNTRVFCCSVVLDSIIPQNQTNINQKKAIGKEAKIFPILIKLTSRYFVAIIGGGIKFSYKFI
jgi:hypothetical protein